MAGESKASLNDKDKFVKKQVEKDKSKKDEEKVNKNVTVEGGKNDYPYLVQLYDIEGTTIFEREPFGARRYIEGPNVFLINEKNGFKEPFPSNSDEFKNYNIAECDRRIGTLTKKLNTLRNKSDSRITAEELDINQEIKKFRAHKRSIELQGEGSYMTVSLSGKPIYSFFRKGNFKLPVFTNVDTSLRYFPNEADISEASELIKLNDKENGQSNNMMKILNIILTVILLLGVIGLCVILWKVGTMPENLADSLTQLTEVNVNLAEKFSIHLDKIQNVSDSLTVATPSPEVIPTEIVVNN